MRKLSSIQPVVRDKQVNMRGEEDKEKDGDQHGGGGGQRDEARRGQGMA